MRRLFLCICGLVPLLMLCCKTGHSEDPISSFTSGVPGESEKALKWLRARGTASIFPLVQVRNQCEDTSQADRLSGLIYDLKMDAACDKESKAILERTSKLVITWDMTDVTVGWILDYTRDATTLNIVQDRCVDTVMKGRKLSIAVTEVPVRVALDRLCKQLDLDYDVRYGVIFLSRPDRLWAVPTDVPPYRLTAKQEREALRWLQLLDDGSPAKHTEAVDNIVRLGPTVLGLMEKHGRGEQSIHSAVYRLVREKMRPSHKAVGDLPPGNTWLGEQTDEDSKSLVKTLTTKSIDMNVENMSVRDAVWMLEQYADIQSQVPTAIADRKITVKVKQVKLRHIVELITIPIGVDVKIANGILVFVENTGVK